LTAGQRLCGLFHFAPGLGKATEMLTGDSLSTASYAEAALRYFPDP